MALHTVKAAAGEPGTAERALDITAVGIGATIGAIQWGIAGGILGALAGYGTVKVTTGALKGARDSFKNTFIL